MSNRKRRTHYGRWTYKYEIAAAKGALGAIIIHTTPTAGYPYSVVRNGRSDESFYLDDPSASDDLAFKAWTSEEATRAYLALAGWSMDSFFALAESRTFRPIDLGLTLSGNLRSSLRQVVTSNVIGLLEGSEYSSLGDDLAAVARELGMTVQSDLHPDQGGFYRSDHFSFAKAGVPAISIAFGTTVVGVDTAEVRRKRDREDSNYHQPSDEIYEDWNYDGILQQAGIAIRVAWRVANAPAMPTWNAGSEFDLARKRTMQ